jgi:hypothetical protein
MKIPKPGRAGRHRFCMAVIAVTTASIGQAQLPPNTLTTSDGYTVKTTPAGAVSLVATVHPLSCTTTFPNSTSCTDYCDYGSSSVTFKETAPMLVTSSVAIPSNTVQTYPCSATGCSCPSVYAYETATLPLSLPVSNYTYSAIVQGRTIPNNV